MSPTVAPGLSWCLRRLTTPIGPRPRLAFPTSKEVPFPSSSARLPFLLSSRSLPLSVLLFHTPVPFDFTRFTITIQSPSSTRPTTLLHPKETWGVPETTYTSGDNENKPVGRGLVRGPSYVFPRRGSGPTPEKTFVGTPVDSGCPSVLDVSIHFGQDVSVWDVRVRSTRHSYEYLRRINRIPPDRLVGETHGTLDRPPVTEGGASTGPPVVVVPVPPFGTPRHLDGEWSYRATPSSPVTVCLPFDSVAGETIVTCVGRSLRHEGWWYSVTGTLPGPGDGCG